MHYDGDQWLEKLAPHEPLNQHRHNDNGEDNAEAYTRLQVVVWEFVVVLTERGLSCEMWERTFCGEFKGRRRKRVLVKILGEQFGHRKMSLRAGTQKLITAESNSATRSRGAL